MKVLDRCGSMYRGIQSANEGYNSGAVTEGAQSGSDLVVANCGDKQEKNSLTCIVTANGNDTATVQLDIRFSASQGKGKMSFRKEQQRILPESDSNGLGDKICSGFMSPSTLVCNVKTPLRVADPALCGLLFSCE